MKESAEALRNRILSGAVTLFIEKGVEKVTTRELTERVGISRSHIYHYFSDWQTLCLEAMTRFLQADLDAFTAQISQQPPAAQLQALMRNYLPEAPDAVWQLYASLWQLAAHNPAYAALAQLMIDKWQHKLEEIIQSGVNEGVFHSHNRMRVTRQLGAMLNGYADLLMVAPSVSGCQQALDDIDDFIRLVLLTS